MTNNSYLSAVNEEELQGSQKQQRFRSLSIFPSSVLSYQLREELKALREDDDVHSVSVISVMHDEDRDKCNHVP